MNQEQRPTMTPLEARTLTTQGDALSAIVGLDQDGPRTYKQRVYRTLYELIQELTIVPGARLVEADLVERFRVSKTPIREALLLLEKDQLVSAIPHVGATVTWLSLAEYEQRLFILDALELPALERVVEMITADDLERCAQIVASITDAYEQLNDVGYTKFVLELHSRLFSAAHYPLLTEMVNQIQESLRRYPKVFIRPFEEEWKLEYETIVERFEHVRRRQPTAAAAAVRERHARLLDAAHARVGARDPRVLPFLAAS
jgi:DNA-binding GntR family transcriptional regulator